MKVLIISSASEKINEKYISEASRISQFLANEKCDLIFGASSQSMMGACYNEFVKKKRSVYAYTNDEYVDGLADLPEAISKVVMTTFELKQIMYEESDLIVCLAGGIGTLSELLSYIEENRSNSKRKRIIIYDKNNFYKHLFLQLESMIIEGFLSEEVVSKILIINNIRDFEKEVYKIKESIKI